MRRVNFKRIQIQNFLSVGETPLVLDYNSGINIITGANLDKEDSGNGIGKSTLVEALYFALFGTTLRDLKVDKIKHYGAKGNCIVSVWFDISSHAETKSYVIHRQGAPSKVQLFENDVDITTSTILKTNHQIETLIRSSPDVFQNSVIMTSNNTPFMMQRKNDKRKFLEGILGLGVFGEMLLITKQQYTEARNQHALEYARLQENQKILNRYLDQYELYRKKKAERLEELNKRIAVNKINIQNIEALIVKTNAQLEQERSLPSTATIDKKIEEMNDLITSTTSNISVLEHKIHTMRNEISKISLIPTICQGCNRPLSKKQISDNQKTIKQLNQSIVDIESTTASDKAKSIDLQTQRKVLISDRDAVVKKAQAIKYTVNEQRTNTESLTRYKSALAEIDQDIAHLNAEADVYQRNISTSEDAIKALRDKSDTLNKKLEIIKTVKFIVSEEGVRSFVVKKILKVMNSRLSYYLKELDANCTCVFNEYFVETLVDEKGRECSYYNFSSGEQKRIDLAILFTFQDLRRLQADVSLNISMYDELLDSSLDRQGTHKVLKLLSERVEKYEENIYIVTHRQDAVESVTGEVIFLEKENGVTRISKTAV